MEYDPENLELLLLSKDALIEDYEQRIAELEKTLEVVEKQRDRFIAKQKGRIAELEKENEILKDLLSQIEEIAWVYKNGNFPFNSRQSG